MTLYRLTCPMWADVPLEKASEEEVKRILWTTFQMWVADTDSPPDAFDIEEQP